MTVVIKGLCYGRYIRDGLECKSGGLEGKTGEIRE
jgi:hypothetical protein